MLSAIESSSASLRRKPRAPVGIRAVDRADVLPEHGDARRRESAVEAEIGKQEGRTVYEVEIIDSNNKEQKVYVDAQSGQAKIDR